MKIHLLLCALLLTSTHAADSIDGIWRWTFPMPDGSLVQPTLRLSLDDGILTGTSSYRPGSEVPITNASFRKDQLQFQVIRTRDGQNIVTTYTGKLSGKTLVGTIESNGSGEMRTYPWNAEKLHGPTGTWKWPVTIGERTVDAQLVLKQSGSKLEGALATRGRTSRVRIKNGSIDDYGQLSFEVETGRGDDRRVVLYKGKLVDDRITGTMESTLRGTARQTDWSAHRVP